MNNKSFDIAKYIEHTNVKAVATENDIKKLCVEAKSHGFYAVCVTSFRTSLAKKFLDQTKVKIVSVVGFPKATVTYKIKAQETKEAVKNGADEIDMVINLCALKDKNYQYVVKDIKEVIKAAAGRPVKVIIEVGYLTEKEIIKSCQIVKKAGAHFIKTGTGYGPKKTKISDIKLIHQILKNQIKIKASGGIRSYRKAYLMIQAGASRIGTSHGVEMTKK